MEYRILGKTGIKVSLMSLGSGGARQLGQNSKMSQKNQSTLIHHALDLGINLIDTSAQYGNSEAIIGKALAGISRKNYFLSTKWYSPNLPNQVESPILITESIENSLTKLRTSYIDIMMFHGPLHGEYKAIIDWCYPILDRLREQGKIRFIGLSTRFSLDPEQKVAELALKNNPELFDVIMIKYGILNQHASKIIMPLAIENNIGIMNMAVIREKLPNQSLLEQLIRKWENEGLISKNILEAKNPLGWLIKDEVDSIISAGYKFAADHPAVSTVITGTANVTHLESNVNALANPRLPFNQTEKLKTLFNEIIEYV
jgi:L-galactose dehydrogenase